MTIITKAKDDYKALANGKIFIWQRDEEATLMHISQHIRQHREYTDGQKPLIIVDYLQIMPPPVAATGRAMDIRQSLEYNLSALAALAAREQLPIIVMALVVFQTDRHSSPKSGILCTNRRG